MKFEDCEPGAAISITLNNDGKKFPMSSKIITIIDDSLVVEPFKLNDAIVEFNARIEIELMVIRPNDVPYYWQRVVINRKIYHDKEVHVITSRLPGVKMNRRHSFRVFIGNSVKMTGASEDAMNVVLHDLSTGGFSIEVPKDIEIPMHSKVVVEYSDNAMKKYYELGGRPIRKLEMERFTIYGCILDNRNTGDLQNYLNEKQLQHRPNKKKES